MSWYMRKQRKYWNGIDYGFYAKLFAMLIVAILIIIALSRGVVWVHKGIIMNYNEYNKAKLINDEIKKICEMEERTGEKLLEKKELVKLKKIYNDEELDKQQATILKAHTNIAKHLCPIGTYVYLDDILEPVRVKSYTGYQADTYEQINFLVTEDKWHTLSRQEYLALKSVREKRLVKK